MPILPSQFDSTPSLVLLEHAAQGLVGFDHRLIDSLLTRPGETLDALESFLVEVRKDDLLDLGEQIFDLYRATASPRAIPFFLKLLERAEPGDIPDELIEAISVFGAAAVEPLLELKNRMDEEDLPSGDIVFVLAALGARDPRVSDLFRETLALDPYEGALCIGLSGDASLKPDVEAALAALPPAAAEERKVLSECIEALSRETEPDPPPAFDIRQSYSPEALPLFDQMKVDSVLEFLDVEDERYRARAASSFLDEEYGDAIRDRLLSIAADDPSPAVRGGACRSLGERLDDAAVRELLLARLQQAADPEERMGLLVGLAGAASLPEVRQAFIDAWNSPPFRAAALEAMWRSLDDSFAPYFAGALSSGDPEIVFQGIHGVGAFAMSDLAIELVPLFEDEDLREDALFAYALAAPGKTTRKSVERFLEEIRAKAGGLSVEEEDAVANALDRRLERAGLEPFFFPEQPPPPPAVSTKIGRNDPCPCGSGKKYKKCCGA